MKNASGDERTRGDPPRLIVVMNERLTSVKHRHSTSRSVFVLSLSKDEMKD